MTLLVALATPKFSVLVADRRLTRDGALFNDESTKLCILCCDDARLAVAFTGTAVLGNESTQDWLRHTLSTIGAVSHTIADILSAFTKTATARFEHFPTATLTLLFSGFVHWSDTPEPHTFTISNCHAFPRRDSTFTQHTTSVRDGIILEAAGTTSSFMKENSAALTKLLRTTGVAADAVSRAAIFRIQRLVAHSSGGGPIGAQCNSAIIGVQQDSAISATYHSASQSGTAFMADVVLASSQHQMVVSGIEIRAEQALAGPSIRKKDACWCNSGKLFQACHMKTLGLVYANLPDFQRPLPFTTRSTSKVAVAAGTQFVVTSGFT